RVVGGAVLGTVPPAPVAAFGRQQRFFRFGQRGRRRGVRTLAVVGFGAAGIHQPCVPEQFPGSDVFATADPNVKIGVDPRSGKDSAGGRNVLGGGNRFTGRERAKILIAGNALVKLAQEIAAVARIIFPGVFAVEKNTNRQGVGRSNHVG